MMARNTTCHSDVKGTDVILDTTKTFKNYLYLSLLGPTSKRKENPNAF